MPLDFSNFRNDSWAYRDCFTINPQKGAQAWERLNLNEWGLEIGMLPKTLHEALLDTLRERQTIKRNQGKTIERQHNA